MKAECVKVFLDSCVWDFLFERNLILENELPSVQFELYITRQAEFEIASIPDNKPLLRGYVERCIEACPVKTRAYFGFYNDDYSEEHQRAGGFGFGELINYSEFSFLKELQQKWGRENLRPTLLYKNEADIALAVRSLSDVVLTVDKKKGPLADAAKMGGRILYLNNFDAQSETLSQVIYRFVSAC